MVTWVLQAVAKVMWVGAWLFSMVARAFWVVARVQPRSSIWLLEHCQVIARVFQRVSRAYWVVAKVLLSQSDVIGFQAVVGGCQGIARVSLGNGDGFLSVGIVMWVVAMVFLGGCQGAAKEICIVDNTLLGGCQGVQDGFQGIVKWLLG